MGWLENMVARRRKRETKYNTYIYRLLKDLHPDMSISKKAMETMNSLVWDVLDRFGEEAWRLRKAAKRKTLGVREIQTACVLLLPDNLAFFTRMSAHDTLLRTREGR